MKTDIDALLQKVLQDKTTYILKNLDSLKKPSVISEIKSKKIRDEEFFSHGKPPIDEGFQASSSIKINDNQNQNQKIDDLLNKVLNDFSIQKVSINHQELDSTQDTNYELVNQPSIEAEELVTEIKEDLVEEKIIPSPNDWKEAFNLESEKTSIKHQELDSTQDTNYELVNQPSIEAEELVTEIKEDLVEEKIIPTPNDWKEAFNIESRAFENIDNNFTSIQKNNESNLIYSFNFDKAPSWIPKANFSRTQSDLIAISEEGEQIIFVDYFRNHELPSVQTENGLLLKGSLLDALAGPLAPGQYAQAAGEGVLSIGEVSSVKGVAKATRLDGNIFTLSNGDPIFKGDVIETEDSGSVGLVFLDKTTMSLSEGGKMVLDELVYDPATGNGSMAVDMLEGAFSFVSGEIAKTGPDAMSVSTPVATIGIRGTTVAGKAAVEGNANSFTLLQDAGGGVGQISVSNAGGTQTLSQVGATTSIASFNAAPPPPIILTAAQIQADYGSALAVLPPTPVVAPQPQSAPPPQEQQQEQQQEEEASEEEGDDSETVEEEVVEEGTVEEGEELEEGEGLGPDGEPLAEEEGIGPDGEPLAEEGIENTAAEELGTSANEEFETALAEGATPEEAMAAAAETGDFEVEFESFDGGIESDSLALEENLPGNLFGDSNSALSGSLSGFDESNLGGVDLEFSGSDNNFSAGEPFSADETNIFNNLSMPGFGSSFVPMNPSSGNYFMSGGTESNIYGEDLSIGGFNSGYGANITTGAFDLGIGAETYFGGIDIGYSADFSLDAISDNYIEYYFEDPSLYEDTTDDTSYAEENETSSTLIGTEAADTLVGGDDGITIDGLGGTDTITGGSGDDVIKGGEGADFLKGGGGNDQFYYGSISEAGDTIYDFDQGDSVLIDYLPTHSSYGRSGYYQTSAQDFSFDVGANSDTIPLVWNFTSKFDNIPNDDYKTPLEVSKHIDMDFTNYDHTLYDDYAGSVATISDYLIITGDNLGNSAIFLWEDNDHDTGFYYDDTELTLLGVLDNYDNANITSSDITFTISS